MAVALFCLRDYFEVGNMTSQSEIKIALCNRGFKEIDQLFQFAYDNNFQGVEYTIEAESYTDFDRTYDRLLKLKESELEIRYHLPFKNIELGLRDKNAAEKSLDYLQYVLDALENIGGRHIITHLGLGYSDKDHYLSYTNAVRYLKKLKEYADTKNIVVVLENLRFGLAGAPEPHKYILAETGCSACLDIGHASNSRIVLSSQISCEEYIEEMGSVVIQAHIYDQEKIDKKTGKYKHFCPQSEEDIRSRVMALRKYTNCKWYLIELIVPEEILETKKMIDHILQSDVDLVF